MRAFHNESFNTEIGSTESCILRIKVVRMILVNKLSIDLPAAIPVWKYVCLLHHSPHGPYLRPAISQLVASFGFGAYAK